LIFFSQRFHFRTGARQLLGVLVLVFNNQRQKRNIEASLHHKLIFKANHKITDQDEHKRFPTAPKTPSAPQTITGTQLKTPLLQQ
jgi:hypothetical protein